MSYKSALPGMFAVPESLVDEHLKLAKETHLKVLLWILRHGEAEGLQALAHWLGRPEGDLVDAVQFWIDRGLVTIDNEQLTIDNQAPALSNTVQAKAPVLPAVPVLAEPPPPLQRPTASQILTRISETPDLQRLFREADRILGRTIGYDGQCALLMLHDNDGLPVEVVYMLLQYCAEAGKINNSYIEAVGRDWGRREIDTIEKAAEQIAALKENLTLWNELRRLAGLHAPKPTAAQSEHLRRWRALGYGTDMVFAAYEEMAEHTGKLSFSYMNKVIENWHAAGIKTPAEAAAAKERFQAGKAKPEKPVKKNAGQGSANGYKTSFDLDAFERSTLQDPVLRGRLNGKGNTS